MLMNSKSYGAQPSTHEAPANVATKIFIEFIVQPIYAALALKTDVSINYLMIAGLIDGGVKHCHDVTHPVVSLDDALDALLLVGFKTGNF